MTQEAMETKRESRQLLLRLVLVTLVTVPYLALAVVGEGGWARFKAHPALVALLVLNFAPALTGLFKVVRARVTLERCQDRRAQFGMRAGSPLLGVGST